MTKNKSNSKLSTTILRSLELKLQEVVGSEAKIIITSDKKKIKITASDSDIKNIMSVLESAEIIFDTNKSNNFLLLSENQYQKLLDNYDLVINDNQASESFNLSSKRVKFELGDKDKKAMDTSVQMYNLTKNKSNIANGNKENLNIETKNKHLKIVGVKTLTEVQKGKALRDFFISHASEIIKSIPALEAFDAIKSILNNNDPQEGLKLAIREFLPKIDKALVEDKLGIINHILDKTIPKTFIIKTIEEVLPEIVKKMPPAEAFDAIRSILNGQKVNSDLKISSIKALAEIDSSLLGKEKEVFDIIKEIFWEEETRSIKERAIKALPKVFKALPEKIKAEKGEIDAILNIIKTAIEKIKNKEGKDSWFGVSSIEALSEIFSALPEERKKDEVNKAFEIIETLLEKERISKIQLKKRISEIQLEKERITKTLLEKEKILKTPVGEQKIVKLRLEKQEIEKNLLKKQKEEKSLLRKEEIERVNGHTIKAFTKIIKVLPEGAEIDFKVVKKILINIAKTKTFQRLSKEGKDEFEKIGIILNNKESPHSKEAAIKVLPKIFNILLEEIRDAEIKELINSTKMPLDLKATLSKIDNGLSMIKAPLADSDQINLILEPKEAIIEEPVLPIAELETNDGQRFDEPVSEKQHTYEINNESFDPLGNGEKFDPRNKDKKAIDPSSDEKQWDPDSIHYRGTKKVASGDEINHSTLITVNKDFFYRGNDIVKLWEKYLTHQNSNVKFYYKDIYNEVEHDTIFNGLTQKTEVAIVIKNDGSLYQNKDGQTITLCGEIDGEGSSDSNNSIATRFQEIIDQIKFYNDQSSNQVKITNHTVIFPYYVNSNHWNLGQIELSLNPNNNQLLVATIDIYEPFDGQSSGYINIIRSIKSSNDFSSIEIRQKEHNEQAHLKQQNDVSSCGAITAENGKEFLKHHDDRNNLLQITYEGGAARLRKQHIEEINEEAFFIAQRDNIDYAVTVDMPIGNQGETSIKLEGGQSTNFQEKITAIESRPGLSTEVLLILELLRQKYEDDMVRWKNEIDQMREQIKYFSNEKIREEFDALKNEAQDGVLYDYAKNFYWSLKGYFLAYRAIATGTVAGQRDKNQLEKTWDKVGASIINATSAIPIAGGILALIEEGIVSINDTYKEMKFDRKVAKINEFITGFMLEKDLDIAVANASIQIARIKKSEIVTAYQQKYFEHKDGQSTAATKNVKDKIGEKVEAFNSKIEAMLAKITKIKTAEDTTGKIMAIKDIILFINHIATNEVVLTINSDGTASLNNIITQVFVTNISSTNEAIRAAVMNNNESDDSVRCVVSMLNEIIYDNPLLNHPELLKESIGHFGMNRALNLSELLDNTLLSEAIDTNNEELILAGMMSLD